MRETLLAILLIVYVSARPQKDPRGPNIIDDNADFGTPEHDNRVHTELTQLVSVLESIKNYVSFLMKL